MDYAVYLLALALLAVLGRLPLTLAFRLGGLLGFLGGSLAGQMRVHSPRLRHPALLAVVMLANQRPKLSGPGGLSPPFFQGPGFAASPIR